MYFHMVGGTESYTTSTTNMYNKYFTYQQPRPFHFQFDRVKGGAQMISQRGRQVVVETFRQVRVPVTSKKNKRWS